MRTILTVTLFGAGSVKVRDINSGTTKAATNPSINASHFVATGGYIDLLGASWSAANFTAGDIGSIHFDDIDNGILLSAEI